VYIPNLKQWLSDNLEGYSRESSPTQMLIIKMLFLPRRDWDNRDLFWIPWQKVRDWGHSGKTFQYVNDKYGFYEVVEHYQRPKEGEEAMCTRYRASELTSDLWERMNQYREPIRLIPAIRGYPIPKCNDTTNIGGLTIRSVVKLDTESLEDFINTYTHENKRYQNTRVDAAHQIYRMANNLTYPGSIPLYYSQPRENGRVYGYGLKLQNAPREVRTAVLNGYIDVDMKNLHYTILNHWGNYPSINYYVENTQAVRRDIANWLKVSPDQVKIALLSIIYGATKGGSVKRHAIPKTFESSVKAEQFWQIPLVNRLKEESKRAGISKLGSDYNRKTLSEELQRIEHQLLTCVCKDKTIIVPMHDGAVLHTEIDTNEAEKRIKDKFGYDVVIKQERINYDTFFYNKRN